ncbi:MAG: hypothetical protein IK093_18865 [Ruminiclostridium sp.]|nr:hypothetical protein [Ruminiclostridium sp.]
MEFYILETVVCIVTFTADMVLRYMEKIRSFGMESRLHNIKGKTIPIEDFIPHNITMLAVFGTAMGVFGIFMKLFGIHPFISFPCALAFGSLVNFTVMHFIKPIVANAQGDELSQHTDLAGYEAVCTDFISGDGYGKIKLVYKGKHYEFDAISEYETDIDEGEKVYVLYRDDRFCVVEKNDEVMDVLNEKEQ